MLTKVLYTLTSCTFANPDLKHLKGDFRKKCGGKKKCLCASVNAAYLTGVLVELGRFLLQQKSSAAGFHSKVWNNDLGDDLIRALAQYSMYPLIFLAVLLHECQTC